MKITGRGVMAVAWGMLSGGSGFLGSIAKKIPNQNKLGQKFAMGTAFHLATTAAALTGVVAAPFTMGGSLSLTLGAIGAEIGHMITAGRGDPVRHEEMLNMREARTQDRWG